MLEPLFCRVLECRIYLDNPADLHAWLLLPRNNIIPRIFESIRPHVLPKLKEERERSRAKGKSKPVNDVVVEGLLFLCYRLLARFFAESVIDDYQVSLFLTNSGTRHSIIAKRKSLREPAKIASNSSRLTTADGEAWVSRVEIRREPSSSASDQGVGIGDVPLIPLLVPDDDGDDGTGEPPPVAGRGGDRRRVRELLVNEDEEGNEQPRLKKRLKAVEIVIGDEGEGEGEDEDEDEGGRDEESLFAEDGREDSREDKKLEMLTGFEGFSIYSRILCVVVKRRGVIPGRAAVTASSSARQTKTQQPGNKVMEDWIAMSQVVREGDELD
jgi:hypothetical protein